MIKSKFLKLSHSDRWDAIKKIKGVLWYCEHCGIIVDKGKRPERMFMGERCCGNCDGTLTRRTNGGQGDPCHYYPVKKRQRKTKK